ncbi:MAG: succinate dehydrogenase, cytochrome b556 subunit [Dehalococcoidia bacterium]
MIRLRIHNRYRYTRVGWWAWVLQRVTGIALVLYLLVHIGVISTAIAGEGTFDDTLAFLQTPVFVVLDLLLLAAVVYHAANGVRIILLDLGIGIRAQATAWWTVMALTTGTVLAGATLTWPLIFP